MQKIILIALAGAAGAVTRYGLSGIVQRVTGGAFPWGTFAVNVLGCFLFGIVWSLAEDRFLVSSEARVIVLIGFMGAFTTFSTFVFETGQLVREAEWVPVLANVAGQIVFGFLALFLGLTLGRII